MRYIIVLALALAGCGPDGEGFRRGMAAVGANMQPYQPVPPLYTYRQPITCYTYGNMTTCN